MVVIPFTHLTPGQWTVKCGAIAFAEAAQSEHWEYAVQLEVLAIESGVEYWDTDLDEESIADQVASAAHIPTRNSPTSGESAPATSSSPATPPTAPPDTRSAETVNSAPLPDDPFQDIAPLADLPLRLQLQHQALVANSRASVGLKGQVMSFSQVDGLPGEGTLWMQLRNPETGDVIHQATQALSIAALPSRFDLPITLPDSLPTRLLVGELSLWTATDPPQILAIQGFTVTLNLDALLEVVANQAERSPDAPFEDLTATDEANTTATENETVTETDSSPLPETKRLASPPAREIPFRLIYLPSTGLTLPPVIYRPADKKSVGAPTLPPFGNQPRRDRQPPSDSPAPAAPAKPLTLPPLGKSRSAAAASETTPPATAPDAELDLPGFGRSPHSPDAPSAKPGSVSQPTETTTSNVPAFQPDFQGRFWHRLSALAEEAQKAAADYKAQLEAAGVDPPGEPKTVPPVDLPFPTLEEDTSNQNYEVVVYEVESPDPSLTNVAETVAEPRIEVLQPGEPDIEDFGAIPIPELLMPSGELIAGTPLPITIQLPIYPRRLAVKVWVTDIQSRTLMDRPRWLMNWTPNSEGKQTALLQLQVPLGSMEARFEAIAIDLATQRESYKATQVRAILPANLPETDLDSAL
jgi:hypothetical protein